MSMDTVRNHAAQAEAYKKLLKNVEDAPAEEVPQGAELDASEYLAKHGVAKPPPPPPGFVASQSTLQQLSARLKTTQAAGTASQVPLKVSEKPFKALVALVVQMQFGSADQAEKMIAELLGMIWHMHVV